MSFHHWLNNMLRTTIFLFLFYKYRKSWFSTTTTTTTVPVTGIKLCNPTSTSKKKINQPIITITPDLFSSFIQYHWKRGGNSYSIWFEKTGSHWMNFSPKKNQDSLSLSLQQKKQVIQFFSFQTKNTIGGSQPANPCWIIIMMMMMKETGRKCSMYV